MNNVKFVDKSVLPAGRLYSLEELYNKMSYKIELFVLKFWELRRSSRTDQQVIFKIEQYSLELNKKTKRNSSKLQNGFLLTLVNLHQQKKLI